MFESFGLNSKQIISIGDTNERIGFIKWISSKSQNKIYDLYDLTLNVALSSKVIFSVKQSAMILLELYPDTGT